LAYFLIGVIITTTFFLTLYFVHKNSIKVSWWQWLITLLCFVYTTFVFAVIVEFLAEGSIKGVIVMGILMGLISIVWAVLLKRFVFVRQTK
jgi:hypothetical protein